MTEAEHATALRRTDRIKMAANAENVPPLFRGQCVVDDNLHGAFTQERLKSVKHPPAQRIRVQVPREKNRWNAS